MQALLTHNAVKYKRLISLRPVIVPKENVIRSNSCTLRADSIQNLNYITDYVDKTTGS